MTIEVIELRIEKIRKLFYSFTKKKNINGMHSNRKISYCAKFD